MKLNTVLISALFFGFAFLPLNAQSQDGDKITTQDMRDLINTNRIPVSQATETTGTPYLFDSFYEGTIVLENGKTTNVLPIRYNAYEQTLEFKDGESAFKMDPNSIIEFEIHVDNNIHTFRKGFDSSRLSEGEFVRLIIDDQVKFMVKHTVSFQQGVASYGSATQQDEYIPNVTYYIKVGNDDVNRIRSLSKRRIMRNIDHFENEIDEFTDNNNIDFSDLNDIEKLLRHYNSLFKN